MSAKRAKATSVFDFDIAVDKMLVRPRVEQLFREGTAHPLTIVHAPTGYSKTTSAMQFLKNGQNKFMYMSLGEMDKNIQRFYKHLCGLFEQLSPDIGERFLKIGFPVSNIEFMQFTEVLIDFLKPKYILVIDDYHVADCPELNAFITRLVGLRHDNLRLIVLSRTLPGFFSVDLQVKRLLFEISKEQLRFSYEETADYYKNLDLSPSEKYISNMNDLTEGWASAIYLSGIYYQKGAVDLLDAAQYNIDRLIENTIYSVYDDEIREFLMKLSILEHFDLELCSYITGSQNAYDLMLRATTDNSLIKVSADKRFYSMHGLFKEFLTKKLAAHESIDVNSLHQRAGMYFEYKKDTLMALYHLNITNNFDDMARIILDLRYANIFTNQELASMLFYSERIVRECGDEKYPLLLLSMASAYSLSVQSEKCMDMLMRTQKLVDSCNLSPELREKLIGETYMVKALLSFNNYNAMLDCCREAVKYLPNGTSIVSPLWSYTFGNPSVMYMYHNAPGKLDEALHAFTDQFVDWTKLTDLGFGCDFLMKAEVEYERCNFSSAEQDAWRANYQAETKQQYDIMMAAQLLLVRICAAQSKYSAAAVIFRDLNKLLSHPGSRVYLFSVDLCLSYYALLTGDMAQMPKWIAEGEIAKTEVAKIGSGLEYVIYSKMLIKKGEYLKVESLLPKMLGVYSIFNNQYGFIRTHITTAIVNFHLYGIEKAIAPLCDAFVISEADGLVMPYLEYEEQLQPIFAELVKMDSAAFPYAEQAEKLRRRMKGYHTAITQFKTGYRADHPGSTLAGGSTLTKREKEILKLIINGLNGEEIAEELFVTPINVRVITSKIYKKLGVNSRVDAVKTALENKLI